MESIFVVSDMPHFNLFVILTVCSSFSLLDIIHLFFLTINFVFLRELLNVFLIGCITLLITCSGTLRSMSFILRFLLIHNSVLFEKFDFLKCSFLSVEVLIVSLLFIVSSISC